VKNFASETSSQRSTITRNCVDKTEGGTSTIAILNNAVRFSADNGEDSSWLASLDRYGKPRRPRRLPLWASDDFDDDDDRDNHWQQNCVRHEKTPTADDDDDSVAHHEINASSASVAYIVENLEDSSTARRPLEASRDADRAAGSNKAKVALALSWESGPVRDARVGSALAARACSEGDVLSGVEAATGRSSRLLSCASTLFGRFLTPRSRLTTVAGVEWRRHRDALTHLHSCSRSVYDASTISGDDCGGLVIPPGARTAAASPDVDYDPKRTSATPREERLPSLSASFESNSSCRRGRLTNTSTVDRPAVPDIVTPDAPSSATEAAGSSCDLESFQQTRSSKKRATIRRYPSVERLDLPRRRAAAATATATLAAGRSPLGADRKRAERFRRQYVDVKLQQRTAPETTKSMFTGIEKCGVSRHDSIASPQLLQVPATAIVTFT